MHVVFPGSFDPPTFGHLNIIERGAKLFDHVSVLVSINPKKKYLLDIDLRQTLMSKLCKKYRNVKVVPWKGLIVDYLKKSNIHVILRGVRSTNDYQYEYEILQINKGLYPSVETIFLPTEERFYFMRSSVIKDILNHGGDLSSQVPPLVLEHIM